jgi:hypothetical protein
MPQTSAASSSRWAADTSGRPAGETSCLTIRLPDISTPQEVTRDLSQPRRESPRAASIAVPPAEPSPPVLRSRVPTPAWFAGSWQRTADILCQKVVPFVRQPKFWLACVTAVAVQVVLAAVMTPTEEDHPEHIRTAANPRPKPAPLPAERIVVPPAPGPHDSSEPVDGQKHGTTTPLGVTAPSDSLDAGTMGQATAETDVDELPPAPRMAENRRLAPDDRKFDGVPVGEADGATLGGIEPLEPMSDSNLQEPRR